MTAPKIVVAGATYALSHRCAFRKLLLTPLSPLVHQGILYALGRALTETDTLLHHAVVMPNHTHETVTTTRPNLPTFKRLFHGEASKFVKVALAEHGFEPPERVFSEGAGHQMRLVNAAAQLTYLHYQDVNTVTAGLVDAVVDYPGFSSDVGLMNGGVFVVQRPPIYFDRRLPDEIEIRFSAPPLLERCYGSSREVVYHLRRARADKERALRAARSFPVLGAQALTKQQPWSEPRSPRRLREGATPSFMVVRDEELRARCCVETTEFRVRHEEARQARLRGEEAVFPHGTYAMRVLHGAPVEDVEATVGRVLSAPGSLERRGAAAPREDIVGLGRALRRDAAMVGEEETEDSLAQRLEAGRGDEVERREAPSVPVGELGCGGEGEPKKLVVLRGSTARARAHRREVQRRREEPRRPASAEMDMRSGEHGDVDPPPG